MAVGGVLLAMSAGTAAVIYLRRQPPPKPAATKQMEPPPGTELRLNGSIRTAETVQVAAPVSGNAQEFAVKPGDEVYEGQILCRIANDALTENEHEAGLAVERAQTRVNTLESRLIAARLEASRLQAELEQKRMELERAERAYQRQAVLNEAGATPHNTYQKALQDYETAKKESELAAAMASSQQGRVTDLSQEVDLDKKALEESQSAYAAAKRDLASADVLAPVDGLVLAIRKAVGERVEQGMPDLIVLGADLSRLELVVSPEPNVLGRIRAGDEAAVELAELPGGGLPAKVKTVEGGLVVIEFSSPSTLIRPGLAAAARLKLN